MPFSTNALLASHLELVPNVGVPCGVTVLPLAKSIRKPSKGRNICALSYCAKSENAGSKNAIDSKRFFMRKNLLVESTIVRKN